ncbi:MAG: DUF4838 domain-containing protein [Kiritimatiellae bacterium]|nr:DUF4838 domain-containing protein [Kiritimatiellia bacterium]
MLNWRWKTAAAGVVLAAGMNAQAGVAGALTLTREGQPAATIVLGDRPTRAAQFAAYELQWHIKAMSGATLPIVREAVPVPAGRVKLYVGDTRAAAALDLRRERFLRQEYAVRSDATRGEMVFAGKDEPDYAEVTYDPEKPWAGGSSNANWPGCWDERGSLHAVYDFLRDGCGVRWLTPTETGTFIPQRPTLTVQAMEVRRRPVFTHRNAPGCLDGHNADFLASLGTLWATGYEPAGEKAAGLHAWESLAFTNTHARIPVGSARFTEQNLEARRTYLKLFMLRMRIGGDRMHCCHSFYGYFARFWERSQNPGWAYWFEGRRPELFAKGYDKESVPPQMCYTSKDLVRQVAQDAANYYDGQVDQRIIWQPRPPTYFPVEPEDNSQYCQCPDCRRLIEKGKRYGAVESFSQGIHSDYCFQFVNAVQQELAKTHPDKGLMTLAYATHAWLPKSVKLDPKIAVQFCFSDSGLEGDWEDYQNEWRLLKEWGAEAKVSGRELHLWLYVGHVRRYSASLSSDFYAFPDFQAHTVVEQMKTFKELGYRGAYLCGSYLEPDAYVSFRTMDNADLDADVLLDEYFTGLYGPAGAPLRKLYDAIERVYYTQTRTPQPKPRKSGMLEAWGQLGTAERMAEWGMLMEEAKTLAVTDREQRNVALFDLAFWKYMVRGRTKFETREAIPQVSAKAPAVPAAGGKLDAVAWDKAAELSGGWFEAGGNKPAPRQLSGRMAHDGTYFYVELVDPCETAKLVTSSQIAPYDDWELFSANQRAQPYRQVLVGPSGMVTLLMNGELNWRMYVPLAEHGIRVASDRTAPDKWVTRLAIPLKELVPGGAKAGGKVYLNVIRVLSGGLRAGGRSDVNSWIASTTSHELDRLAEVTLE